MEKSEGPRNVPCGTPPFPQYQVCWRLNCARGETKPEKLSESAHLRQAARSPAYCDTPKLILALLRTPSGSLPPPSARLVSQAQLQWKALSGQIVDYSPATEEGVLPRIRI